MLRCLGAAARTARNANAPSRAAASGLDAVLLDVDNGPGFLLHPANAELYAGGLLAAGVRALRPGGVLAVWSAERSPQLLRTLGRVGVREREVLRLRFFENRTQTQIGEQIGLSQMQVCRILTHTLSSLREQALPS